VLVECFDAEAIVVFFLYCLHLRLFLLLRRGTRRELDGEITENACYFLDERRPATALSINILISLTLHVCFIQLLVLILQSRNILILSLIQHRSI